MTYSAAAQPVPAGDAGDDPEKWWVAPYESAMCPVCGYGGGIAYSGDKSRVTFVHTPGVGESYDGAPDYARQRDAHSQEAARILMNKTSSRHLAHDSGDGMDLAHCPFCGSGGIIGGSDGTVECQFCHKFFTVQVQPEFKSMPQTIDGQPYNIPGMPGGGPDAGGAQDQRADDIGEAQEGGDQLEDQERDPSEDGPPTDGPPKADNPFAKKDDKKKQPNPFAKGSLLITAEGIALPPEAYLQHLALAYADDRGSVLAQVKQANLDSALPLHIEPVDDVTYRCGICGARFIRESQPNVETLLDNWLERHTHEGENRR